MAVKNFHLLPSNPYSDAIKPYNFIVVNNNCHGLIAVK